jgi:hypothetical protein
MSEIAVSDSVAETWRPAMQRAETVLDTFIHLALEVRCAVRHPGGRVAAAAEGAELAGFCVGRRCDNNSRSERDRDADQ